MPPIDHTVTEVITRDTGTGIIAAVPPQPGAVDPWRWHRFALGIIMFSVALGCAAVMLRVAWIAWHLHW